MEGRQIRLNLGCGRHTPAGWINVDWALGARFAKVPMFQSINRRLRLFDQEWAHSILLHDLRKSFPWPDESVDVVYSSHLLEHLDRDEGLRFLRECRRVLRSGGLLRIVAPDLRNFVDSYVEGTLPAADFVEKLGVLYGSSKSGLKRQLAPLYEFPHKCMYDATSLIRALDACGFHAAARDPFDSSLTDIRIIELPERTIAAAIAEGVRR